MCLLPSPAILPWDLLQPLNCRGSVPSPVLVLCVCISWLMMHIENENGVWELLFGVLVLSESSNGILAQLVQWNVHPAYEEMNGCLS